jgi:hypothetical protein
MSAQQKNNLIKNQLLAAPPRHEYERILPHLEHDSFSLGESIYESGKHMKHVYFPTTCIASLLYTMEIFFADYFQRSIHIPDFFRQHKNSITDLGCLVCSLANAPIVRTNADQIIA